MPKVKKDNELQKPISLRKASEILAEKYPKFAYSETQLRTLCKAGFLPCQPLPAIGMVRQHRYFVNLSEVVAVFEKHYQPARNIL